MWGSDLPEVPQNQSLNQGLFSEWPVGFSIPPPASLLTGPKSSLSWQPPEGHLAKSLASGPSSHALPSLPGWCGTGHTQPAGCSGCPLPPLAWRPGPEGKGRDRGLLSQAQRFLWLQNETTLDTTLPGDWRASGSPPPRPSPRGRVCVPCVPRRAPCFLGAASAVLGLSFSVPGATRRNSATKT